MSTLFERNFRNSRHCLGDVSAGSRWNNVLAITIATSTQRKVHAEFTGTIGVVGMLSATRNAAVAIAKTVAKTEDSVNTVLKIKENGRVFVPIVSTNTNSLVNVNAADTIPVTYYASTVQKQQQQQQPKKRNSK